MVCLLQGLSLWNPWSDFVFGEMPDLRTESLVGLIGEAIHVCCVTRHNTSPHHK